MDLPLGDVAYNLPKLAEFGAIEMTGTERVRGATRHFYAITPFGEEVGTWARKMERYGRKAGFAQATDANLLAARRRSGLTPNTG